MRRKTADLEAKERRLQEIIEGTRAATWVFDVATGAIEINEHWAEMLGYRVEELRPIRFETFRGFVHPDDWAHTQDRIDRHLAGEIDHYASELRMRHRDGRWIWVHDRAIVIRRAAERAASRPGGTRWSLPSRPARATRCCRPFGTERW